MKDKVLNFIHRRFKNDCDWKTGNCYYFTVILKNRFPEGKIFYNVQLGHFVFGYDGKFYDWDGLVDNSGFFIDWDKFDDYDYLQKKRIIQDCIL